MNRSACSSEETGWGARACPKAAPIGHQRPARSEGDEDTPAGQHPLHPPARPRHDVDEEQPGVDDHERVNALEKALLSVADDAVFLGAKLTLFLDLASRGFDIIRVDAGLDRGGYQVFMRERFERLGFERPSQNLFDLVSRVLSHAQIVSQRNPSASKASSARLFNISSSFVSIRRKLCLIRTLAARVNVFRMSISLPEASTPLASIEA